MTRRSTATLCLSVLALLVSFAAHAEVGASQLKPEYQRWLKEDVRWIITDQERHDFMKLETDDQRDQFIVSFWERRNPTPHSATNAFKEEHYRRLAYVNEHFAANVPGWHTDRGRIYIMYGPPEHIEVHRGSGHAEAVSSSPDRPWEVWHYNHIPGLNEDVDIRFVDECSCGDYKMVD